MDSTLVTGGRASTLSTPQKALAILLSIILVVGLSPFGQAPAKAYASPPVQPLHGTTTQSTDSIAKLACTQGTFYYTDFQDALRDAAGATNSQLTVLKNFDVTKPMYATAAAEEDNGANVGMTIDLANFTVTVKADATASTSGSLVFPRGATTIQNGTIAAQVANAIVSEDTDNDSSKDSTVVLNNVVVTDTTVPALSVKDGGKVTSTGTSYTATTATTADNGVVSVDDADFTMPSGSITNRKTGGNGVYGIAATGESEVSLGVKDAKTGPSVTSLYAAVKAANGAEVSIYGGTYDSSQATATADEAIAALYVDQADVNVVSGTVKGATYAATTTNYAASKLTIADGSFTSGSTATTAAAFCLGTNSVVTVNGGTIGKASDDLIDRGRGAGFIAGGTYNAVTAPTDGTSGTVNQYATGYVAKTGATAAPWTVLKDMGVATIVVDALTYNGTAQSPVAKVYWPSYDTTKPNENVLDSGAYTLKYYSDAFVTELTAGVTSGTFYAAATPTDTAAWTGTAKTAALSVEGIDLGAADSGVEVWMRSSSTDTYVKADSYKPMAGTSSAPLNPQVQLRLANGTQIDATEWAGNVQLTNFTTNLSSLTLTTPGEKTFTITAGSSGKFKGAEGSAPATSMTAKFTVAATNTIAQFAAPASVAYTGAPQNIVLPTVYNNAGTQLTQGTNYTWEIETPKGGTVPSTSFTATTVSLTDAGTYTFKAIGREEGGYTDTASAEFQITPLSIADATKAKFTLNDTYFTAAASGYSATYSKALSTAKIIPTNTSTKNYAEYVVSSTSTIPMVEGVDFSVSPQNILKAGAQTVTITGLNGFTGTQTISVNVAARTLPTTTLTVAGTTYTGEERTPSIVPLVDSTGSSAYTLVEGVDYTLSCSATPVDAGTYTVTATGINGYTGTATGTFTIDPKALTTADVTMTVKYSDKQPKIPFTGEPVDIAQYTTVKYGDKTLANGTDYTLSPATLASTGQVYAYFQGNYSGYAEGTATFTSVLLSEAAEFTSVEALTYDPTTSATTYVTPKFTLTNKDTKATLVQGTDFEISEIYKADDTAKADVKSTLKDAGSYVAVLKGKGSYAGALADKTEITTTSAEITAEFEIAPFDLTGLTVPTTATVTVSSPIFDGTEQTAVVTTSGNELQIAVSDKKTISLAQSDFDATKAIDAGSYDTVITGKDNYTGTIEFADKPFKIQQVDLSNTNIKTQFKIADGVYADTYVGAPGAKPEVRVIMTTGEDPYVFDASEYTVTYGGNTTAGAAANSATVDVKATGAKNAKKDTSATPVEYSVSTNTLASYKLDLGVDEATVAYKAAGYTLDPSIKEQTSGTELDNTAFAIYKDDATEPLATTGYKLTDAGTYRVVGYTTQGYAGTVEATFTIEPADIADATITYTDGKPQTITVGGTTKAVAYTYTGKALKLKALAAKDKEGYEIADMTDSESETPSGYTIAYENNVNAGTATATLTGVGNYGGTATVEFEIGKADFNDFAMVYSVGGKKVGSETYEATYTGSAIEPAVVVTNKADIPTKELVEGTDYELVYAGNVDANAQLAAQSDVLGIYAWPRVVAVPLDSANFNSASATYPGATFVINPADLSSDKLDVKAEFEAATYTGSQLTPRLTITYTAADGTKNTLYQGLDYTTPVYSNNVEPGTGTAMVVGMGNYAGTYRPTFEIAKADLSEAVATLDKTSAVYSGQAQSASVTSVKLGGVELPAEAYAATAATGTDAGTYYAKVEAKDTDHYTGANDKAAAFTIAKAASTVSVADVKATFNGKAVTATATKTGSSATPAVKYFKDKAATKAISAPKNAGTYYAKATLAADANYEAAESAVATITIAKAANPVKVKAKQALKAKASKKTKFKASKVFKVTTPKGKVTFKKANKAGGAKIAVDAGGSVTVAKGLKAGTYKVKVKATSKGNKNYKPGTKKVTVKVKVTKK